MSIHIYHPNKGNTGFACSFSQGRDGTIYATLLKQSGWDAERQNGTFKASVNDPLKSVNIKLGQVEVAAILDCLDRNRQFSNPHDSDKQMKSIRFEPWKMKDSNEQRGFSFSVTVTDKEDSSVPKNSFYIGLNFAEGRLVREYLMTALHKSFDVDFSGPAQAQAPAASDDSI